MDKKFWKALLKRAEHAVWQAAVSTLPATIVITPAMIEHFNWETAKGVLCIVLAWAGTALFAGILSAAKSMKVGMPEVELLKEVEPTEHEDTPEMLCDKEAE